MMDPWLGFVNEQVSERGNAGTALEQARLRQRILDRSACSFPFPLEVTFRAVVAEQCEHANRPYLLAEPVLMRDEAVDVLGGILLPSTRDLREGSVLDVVCHLADPDTYHTDQGILAEDADLDAVVPIEP